MDEAKNRGSEQDRIAQALGRTMDLRAPVIRCNSCGSVLPGADRIDVKSLKGIEIAYKSYCAACEQDTWAVKGESASVRAFYEALEKTTGQLVQLGTARPASSD